MSFQALLAELDELQLAKSAPVDGGDNDDANIEAAAEDGEDKGEGEDASAGEGGAGDDAGDADGGEGKGDDDEGESFGKSFRVTLPDGSETDAVDATDLVKSLTDQVEALGSRFEGTEGDMLKALGSLTDLVKSQQETIGALSSKVDALANAGRGRKATVAVIDKPTADDLAKSHAAEEPQGMSQGEFMAKAMDALNNGKITGLDVAKCEGFFAKGLPIPANISNRVLA